MKKLQLDQLGRPTIEEYAKQEKMPIVLVLDNVRSAMNVGSIFRTADAFGIDEIYLCGITATPPNREITKTAIGATESVKWKYFEQTSEAIQKLKLLDYIIVGVEQTDQSKNLNHVTWSLEKTAIVLGNEVEGISDEVIELLNDCIEIPQVGTKHSLNVSVCAGLVIWEVFKKFKQ